MRDNKQLPATIDEAVRQMVLVFPKQILDEILELDDQEISQYQYSLKENTITCLMKWLHNKTQILEQCGLYSIEEISGYVVWQLKRELQSRSCKLNE